MTPVDINRQISEIESNLTPSTTTQAETERKRRATRLYHLLKLNEFKCQACSFSLLKTNGKYYIEACHILPHNTPGNQDYAANLLILCPNCHKTFDFGDRERKMEIIARVRSNYPGIALNYPI